MTSRGLTRDDLIARVILVVAVATLGLAGGLVLIHDPAVPAATAASPQPRHHTLDSPYGSQPFTRGQPQAQTLVGAGHAYPSLLGAAYARAGYQWLTVTDAGTVTPTTAYRAAGLLPVPGADLDYPFGTFLAVNVDRVEPAVSPHVAVDWVHNAGGVAFVARPLQPPAMSYEAIASLQRLDGIEVFDARMVRDDPQRADATALWDRLLTDHHQVWGIVGDDSLDDSGPSAVLGQTSVEVQVDQLTPFAVAAALGRGAFVDSNGVRITGVSTSADTISVVTENADTIQFIGSGGRVVRTVTGKAGDYRVDWSEGYIRVLATGAAGGRGWTQPIVVNP